MAWHGAARRGRKHGTVQAARRTTGRSRLDRALARAARRFDDHPVPVRKYHAAAMSNVLLRAPVSGILVPLDKVPDPVFAQRMVGDGISIDPTSSTLVAPCAGRIAHLHSARHAITLTTADGLEVMIHVGLDTVKLQGRGFTAHVADGDEVREGQTLLEFDADVVAQQARSLLTQVVITNGDRVAHMTARTGTVAAGRDTVLEIHLPRRGRRDRAATAEATRQLWRRRAARRRSPQTRSASRTRWACTHALPQSSPGPPRPSPQTSPSSVRVRAPPTRRASSRSWPWRSRTGTTSACARRGRMPIAHWLRSCRCWRRDWGNPPSRRRSTRPTSLRRD